MIGHWPFDDGTATDVSGNGNDGTVNGAVLVPGQVGAGALDFDGTNDYVDVGNIDLGGAAVTFAAWISPDNLANCGSIDCRIAAKANGVSEQAHYFMLSTINSSGVKLRFRLKAGGTTSTLIAGTGILSNGEWVHVAATYDGSNMRLYLDGAEVGIRAKTGLIDSNTIVPFWVGGNPDGATSRPWDGQIDDVRLYDSALGLGEIQDLATLTPPTPTPIPPTPTPEPPDSSSNISFSAITGSPQARFGQVVFDQELFDFGDVFDSATGNFIAPSNGVYLFNSSVTKDNLGMGYPSILKVNGNTRAVFEAEITSDGSIEIHLNIGDVVQIWGLSNESDFGVQSRFEGSLVHKVDSPSDSNDPLKGGLVNIINPIEDSNGDKQIPKTVGFAPDGVIWVLDWNGASTFLPDGTFVQRIESIHYNASADIAFTQSGSYYVSCCNPNRIAYFDELGNYVRDIGDIIQPNWVGIDVDIDENVYGASPADGRILKFAPDGSLLLEFNTDSSALGPMQPYDVAIAENGDVYVLDSGNDRVVVFDSTANPLLAWPIPIGPGDFFTNRFAFGPTGDLFIQNQKDANILQVDVSGQLLGTWSAGLASDPGTLALSGSGTLAFVDSIGVLVFGP